MRLVTQIGPSNRAVLCLGILSLNPSGCTSELNDQPWLISQPRILAIQSENPEVTPGETARYKALVVGADGAQTITWSFCMRARAAHERQGVSDACQTGKALLPLVDPSVVPSDACSLFGPNSPPTQGDAPPSRPTDPDSSGGYYIPVHAQIQFESATSEQGTKFDAFGFQRIHCDLPGVTRQVFDGYQDRYRLNNNPQIDIVDAPPRIQRGHGADVTVIMSKSSSEHYVRYDSNRAELVDVRETLQFDWYVSSGTIEQDIDNANHATVLADETYLHETKSVINGWVVVRDDRGGITWKNFELHVVD